MALPGTLGFGVLLALPGALASGSGPDDGAGSNVVTIVLLLLLLLLLVTGLALAWRRLSHASGGYYHPARLGAMLWGRTCRLLWASPAGRWLRARTELGSPEEPEPQEDEQDAEDFMMDGGPEGADAKEEEQRCEAQQTPDAVLPGMTVLGEPGTRAFVSPHCRSQLVLRSCPSLTLFPCCHGEIQTALDLHHQPSRELLKLTVPPVPRSVCAPDRHWTGDIPKIKLCKQ
uniref:Protein tyrosine phosphatase, receptor type, C-associated protein n=1 Tax=Rattus norvegicus TaxID=10116 RepID=Q5I0I6_RAT